MNAPHDDPIARFQTLLEEAQRIPRDKLPEPTAFALGTVDESGQPSVRILLLKGVDERGFTFYTNFQSRKGRELLASHRAAIQIPASTGTSNSTVMRAGLPPAALPSTSEGG